MLNLLAGLSFIVFATIVWAYLYLRKHHPDSLLSEDEALEKLREKLRRQHESK